MRSEQEIRNHYEQKKSELENLRNQATDALSDEGDSFDEIASQIDELFAYIEALEYALNLETSQSNVMLPANPNEL